MHTRQAKLELLMAGPYGNDYGLAFFLDRLDERGVLMQLHTQDSLEPPPGSTKTVTWSACFLCSPTF